MPATQTTTFASITREFMSGISARFMPAKTLSPTLKVREFVGPWL